MLESRPVAELTPRMQQLFERARTSFQTERHTYAVELLRTILEQEPGCAEVRRVLHAACREIHANDSSTKRFLAAAKTFLPLHVQVPRLFGREQHVELLELLEDLLQRGAPARPVLGWLFRLAETCNLPETATVALESLVASRPNDPSAWREYVSHCRKHDLHKRALHGLHRLAKLRPRDVEIESELRQVIAADTVAEAHWDEAGSYREVLRDEAETLRLEEERRPGLLPADTVAAKVRITAAKADADNLPTVDNQRRLGDLLREAGDLDGAMAQYERASMASQQLDPVLDDAITSCLSERAAADIEQWRKYARENEGRADLAAARIEELEAERDAALLARYENRVRRFPMESRYQAELGALYLAAARFDEALRCYQSARRNPASNLSAGVGVGRSLAGKGLHDLAEREFLDCLALTSARSRERLAVLYELAALYQVLGREEESFGQLKDIYAIDASYRDVGSRLDEYVRIRDAAGVPGAANDSENAI